jgi:hypothetical protein
MQLSEAPNSPHPWVDAEYHVPFTAYLKIAPARGKREEIRRYYEILSERIEQVLETFCGNAASAGEYISFDFSTPVAWTPQFGNATARFTINGHACKRKKFTSLPVGQQQIDADNNLQIGNGAGNAANMTPSTTLDAVAKEVVEALEVALGLKVFKIKVAGYNYGLKGTTIPSYKEQVSTDDLLIEA